MLNYQAHRSSVQISMKNYLKPNKPVSPCSDQKIEDYLAQGLTIQSCSHGESGGLSHIVKSMMSPSARKAASSKFNERRNAA